jgi:CxxC motif-containing protein (DUF1111 family)
MSRTDRLYSITLLVLYLFAIVPPVGVAIAWVKARARAGVRPGRQAAGLEPRRRVVDHVLAPVGSVLFTHEWQPNDPLCPNGDGLGPVFNATSCAACHHQGGTGGSGGLEHNVTAFTDRSDAQRPREGVVHAHGVPDRETLRDVHKSLPPLTSPTLKQLAALGFPRGVHVSQRNTPALFGAGLIDAIPQRVILEGAQAQQGRGGTAGRALLLADRRVGRFGWKAQAADLSDFVQAACANELGLGNPGHPQPTPLSAGPPSRPPGLDLSQYQCDQLTAFCASLPRPVLRVPGDDSVRLRAGEGQKLFETTGCAACHTPKLGAVDGLYSDLLLHDMGEGSAGGGSYGGTGGPGTGDGPSPGEWRTPPLWGVADSAPYLHDGRAATLEEAIRLHGGQGQGAARAFGALPGNQKASLIAFLQTLHAP